MSYQDLLNNTQVREKNWNLFIILIIIIMFLSRTPHLRLGPELPGLNVVLNTSAQAKQQLKNQNHSFAQHYTPFPPRIGRIGIDHSPPSIY
jgi:hypothetical protein